MTGTPHTHPNADTESIILHWKAWHGEVGGVGNNGEGRGRLACPPPATLHRTVPARGRHRDRHATTPHAGTRLAGVAGVVAGDAAAGPGAPATGGGSSTRLPTMVRRVTRPELGAVVW